MSTEQVKTDEPTIGRLVTDATKDLSSLLQNEIKLAKSELRVSVKNGTTGALYFSVAGFLAVLAVIMFSVALAYLIHWNGRGLDLHWAYLIVTVFYLILAGVFTMFGVRKVKKVRAPERAMAQANATVTRLKG